MRFETGLAALLVTSFAFAQAPQTVTDAQVRALIIQESHRSYSGNCPCPENVDRAGHRCGGRSAWSRAGGAKPFCYPNEVSDDQVKQYRQAHSLKRP